MMCAHAIPGKRIAAFHAHNYAGYQFRTTSPKRFEHSDDVRCATSNRQHLTSTATIDAAILPPSTPRSTASAGARTTHAYCYLTSAVGISVTTGFGFARAGLFTLAAAHPFAFFLASFASSQTALAATKVCDGSHPALRHAAFIALSVVLGAGSAAVGPIGLGTLLGASLVCGASFFALSAASTVIPNGVLKSTDGLVDYGGKVWFVCTLASLALPALGALRGVQILLAAGGTALFATQLMRNSQQLREDATKDEGFNAMQSAVRLAFPTFCIFTFSPSIVRLVA